MNDQSAQLTLSSELENEHHLMVFGMRRSGNHAVISWLVRNLGSEKYVFLNDCAKGDPWRSFAALESDQVAKKHPPFKKSSGFVETQKRHLSSGSQIVSYEDLPVQNAFARNWLTSFPSDWEWKKIALHRGFCNWLASFLPHVRERHANTRWGVTSPLEVAPFIVKYRKQLAGSSRDGVVSLSFDRWVKDEGYRTSRLQALGLSAIDNTIGEQSGYGGGSSFTGTATTPDSEALTDRWRLQIENQEYRSLISLSLKDEALLNGIAEHYPEDIEIMRNIVTG